MDIEHLIASGRWYGHQITTTEVASTFAPDAATVAAVEAAWATTIATAGMQLYDGPTCRLERLTASPAGLAIAWSRNSYKWFLGTNGRNPDLAQRGDAIGTSAAVVSADGWLVFGKRAQSVPLYPGYAHPFGGILEPAAPVDVIADMARELREELGLDAADIGEICCLGLGVDPRLRQPELIFHAPVQLTRDQLTRQINREEHSADWCVRAEAPAIDAVLRDPLTDLTPVTRLVLARFRATL